MKEILIFYIKDHLGNNRVVANASGGAIQSTQYYPFGMAFAEGTTTEQGKQPYKYNGKELDQSHGLNQYDYQARFLDNAYGRFTTQDPLSEKFYSWSPYVYCFNNPVRFTDPDGKDGWDTVIGWGIGLLTNILPNSSSIRDAYSPNSSYDYNQALENMDKASMLVGAASIISGAGATGSGGALVVAGGVVSGSVAGAPEGAAISVTGAVILSAGEASIAGGVYLMGNTASNAGDGYNRGEKPAEGSAKERTSKDPLRRDSHGNPKADPEAAGTNHTQLGVKEGRKGSYKQAREFDSKGLPVKDIDFTDHGRPQNHPNPHQHKYVENATGGTRQRSKRVEPLN